ncbi:hypothetical protein SASPL_115886 [Salvia splendens]|uniref:Myb proto-oncogene protein, plant n=1 Tax=Salvia splendens TaxID=180675 RepID=A0A8X8Y3C4_SALSN|nr:hypothetical protein SASPL_115886 [Salvia splendens]
MAAADVGSRQSTAEAGDRRHRSRPRESITWVKIAESLEKRNDNACRQRWVNVLDPSIVKGPFTRQEEEILLREHIIHGEAKPEKTEGQIEATLSLYRSKKAKAGKQLEDARSKAAKAEKQLEEEEAGDDPPLPPQIDPPLQPPQFVLPLKARMKMDHMEIGRNPPAPAADPPSPAGKIPLQGKETNNS